ncbi:hypothetical protein CKM354_001177900 [Cercospora kikuchii]|uniref:ABM domain-containing protein n=1 Tax=Cercospora kikuchii TaxID=84275 RepID=A0A9P3CQ51_9PEZI|nr:uncharacterized protein CKM354_001177900 [Cercospora kikuchii]GIZ48729.1 hypothetical protein CKM354_001177900 [Cercospora kikuchii]
MSSSGSGKQLTLFVTMKIKPDRIEEWKEAHRPVWAATAAEPEQIFFDLFEDPKDPGTFRFIEVWSKDREWFEKEQFTKDYYKTLWPKSEPTWREPVQVEYYERSGDGLMTYRQGYLDLGKKME